MFKQYGLEILIYGIPYSRQMGLSDFAQRRNTLAADGLKLRQVIPGFLDDRPRRNACSSSSSWNSATIFLIIFSVTSI